ncbi:DUF2269 domain-containing protein [Paenibacillus favisporus]|uniref:DUF2269 domain-containing protein n=1 Tax=Paenibacillus favisporus TaxID=221028 RepID=UPI002DBB1020|nr:DUF2269 domain-containing protein [Paenibacillus favisporus]MEC0175313.1 DUF2269 domain-containing protein [Paenibacillus favisporus]
MSAPAMKWLKIVHIVLVSLFFGGILSSVTVNFALGLNSYEDTLKSYKVIVLISDGVIRTGAVGTLAVTFVYGFFTPWGFFRHRWLTVKWILFLLQTFIGIFVVDKLMLANLYLLETLGPAALEDPGFLGNHGLRNVFVFIQIVLTLVIFVISVIKPWKKKRK